MGSVQEMAARGATTIGVIEKGDDDMKNVLSHCFEIPKGYSNYISKEYAEIVRPVKYSTEDLYGTPTLSMLDGEIPYIKKRIEMLDDTLAKENAKHWRGKDMHLVAEIMRGIKFWEDRLKEIKYHSGA